MSAFCEPLPDSSEPAPPWRRLPLPSAHQALLRCIDKQGARWSFFDARNISRIWVRHKYARFLVMGQYGPSERWLEQSLQQLAVRLQPLGFLQVHRSELVNLRFLRAIDRGSRRSHRNLFLELLDGQRAQVSRRLAPKLRRALAELLAWPTQTIEQKPPPC